MEEDDDQVEFCMCGHEMYPEDRRFGGFCSRDCEQEYDEMMTESWNNIFLALVPPEGSA